MLDNNFLKITSTQIHENQWIGQVQRTYWYTTVHTCKYSERLCFSKFRFGIESIEFFLLLITQQTEDSKNLFEGQIHVI